MDNFRSITRTSLGLLLVNILLASCGSSSGGGGGGSVATTGINFTNGQSAALVVGQADFVSNVTASDASGLSTPYSSAHVAGSKLYIPDLGNNRVVVFNSIPTINGASADFAVGQPDLTTVLGGVSATTALGSQGTVVAGGKLFVTEFGNNRVSIYNTLPTTSPGTIDVVLGQADKNSLVTACTATGLNSPENVWVAGSKIVVADGANNRVLIWNSIPTTDGQAADLVLGQADFTSCQANAGGVTSASSLSFPTAVWTDGTRLIVLDTSNSRALIWNSFPASNNQTADLVLGQADFTSNISNRAVSVAANTLSGPYEGLHVVNNQLFITDSGNNRVSIWNRFPTTDGQAANKVLGQANFTTATNGLTNATLDSPVGVFLSDKKLIVTDVNNNRVLIYNGS